MNTANKLTLLRVVMIPAFLLVLYLHVPGANYWALAIFALASITDTLDGYIARHYNQITDFGKFMDPLADKCLVTAAMLWFVEIGQMPAWALLIVIIREFAVSGLRMVAADKGRVIAAGWSGKVKTASTMVCIVLMLLPGGNAEAEPAAGSPDAEAFDRAAVQEEMENILRAIDGVGELRLMLTVDSGTKRELAQDTTAERSGSEDMKRKSETVVVGTGSGTQEVVVTNRVYPRYVGALVVCEGGGSAGVRLAVTQAVSALTALPSDKITVLQGKP